jgi:hypothetical protein
MVVVWFHEILTQVTKSYASYCLTITQDMWLICIFLGIFHKCDYLVIPV